MTKKNKVLLVGWDAADWKIIDKLMANGLMPAMKSVVENGVRGQLSTLDPPLSPMLWTSIATGVRPFDHGVLGFVEPDGAGGVRPVSSNSRRVKAIWNMLTMEGYKSNIIGWWPSNPVESINGCMVSNLFQQEKKGKEVMDVDNWEMAPGTIYPERLVERLKALRVHPHEITGNLVMPFVPQAVALDQKEDKRLSVIQKFIAHASTIHAAATELMETEEWDFTAVYHDAIDHFCHAFMKFHPPKMDNLDEEEFELFKDVVVGAYIFHDMMLERLLGMIDEDTTLMIVSDHGFHSDHLRPKHIPQVPSGPAVEHAPFGIFVAKGPGIKKGERIYGASILDVTPTLLSLFDLPVGKNMHGKPLVDIFDHPREVKFIESWEKVDKFGGDLVIESKVDPATNEAALQQLIDLGYIDDMQVEGDPEKNRSQYVKNVIAENNLYLARSYASAGYNDEALEILLEIESRDKPDFRILLEIVGCAVKTGRFALAEEYLRFIRAKNLMSDNFADVLDAKIQMGLNNPDKALKLLESAAETFKDALDVLLDLGRLLNTLGQYDRAEEVFRHVIDLDPQNAYGYNGLGVAALRTERYEEALSHFLDAIERIYYYPFAHFNLGETFALMNQYEAAIQAFHVVENIAPSMPKTYRWLLDMYEITGNEEMAERYRRIVKKYEMGEKVIVTGLPGATLEAFIERMEKDGVTIGGDPGDPLGVRLSVIEKGWLQKMEGHVIYVPMKAIPSLPPSYSYRMIFVNDDPEKVMAHLQSKGRVKSETYNPDLLDGILLAGRKVKTWLSQQPNLDITYLNSIEDIDSQVISQYIAKI